MRRLSGLIVIGLLTLGVAGCSEPKIDTSSMPTTIVSIEEVRAALSEERRSAFDHALAIINLSAFEGFDALRPNRMNVVQLAESANMQINGLTGEEVISRAEGVMRQRLSRERQESLRTLERLEERAASADRDLQARSRFVIDEAAYYVSRSPYGAREPVIDISVSNQTDRTITQVQLRGVLTSEGRTSPWVDSSFYYVIPGGLAPGESAKWSLAPNRFGHWGDLDIPSNTTLDISLLGLQGEGGQPLWNAPMLTEQETERLTRLRGLYTAERLLAPNTEDDANIAKGV